MGEPSISEPLVLQFLGGFRAHRGGMPLPDLHRREGERLLVYLALHASEPITSRELAQRFWPFEAQANPGEQGDYPNVRQALRSLRQSLGPDADRLTRPYRGAVQLDVSGFNVDVFAFDQLARIQSENEWPAAYAAATALYRGPLLAAWNESWLTAPRKRRQRDYENILRRLIQHAKQQDRTGDIVRWTHLLLEVAPDDEVAQNALLLLRAPSPAPGKAKAPDKNAVPPSPPETTPEAETLSLEVPGGAVPLTSPFYIVRQTDHQFEAALKRRDPIILLKGPHQAGKTSLLARGLHAARQTDVRVVVTDFKKINDREFSTPDTLYQAFAISLAQQLGIAVSPRDVWDEDFGPNYNFERFLCASILPHFDAPLIWAMDEVDRLLACPFGGEVFNLFRSWYNERSLNPDSVLTRVSLIITYATEAHLFITDLNQSPFNVGTRLSLSDFSPEQVSEMNRCYRHPLQAEQLSQVQDLVGGQPYLTRCIFDQVASGTPLAQVLAETDDDNSVFGDHLRRLWRSVSRSPHLLETLRALLTRQSQPKPDDFYRLRASGVLSGPIPSEAVFRCRLYESYFSRQIGDPPTQI